MRRRDRGRRNRGTVNTAPTRRERHTLVEFYVVAALLLNVIPLLIVISW